MRSPTVVLATEEAVVESTIKFTSSGKPAPLYLDGEELELRSIALEAFQRALGAWENLFCSH